MMKRFSLIIIGIVFALPLLRAREIHDILTGSVTPEELRSCIVPHQQWVPYPAYADRVAWEKLMGDAREMYIKKGEAYLDYSWQYVKTSSYLAFEKTGDRMIMQRPYEANIDAVGYLLRAELAEGKGRFIPDLLDGTMCLCEMTTWALSAHLVSHSSTHRAVPDNEEPIVELRQSKVAEMLSWIWYYFHDEFDNISPVFAKRLRKELQQRMLDPFMTRDDFWWMGFKEDKKRVLNNWTIYCAFNSMMCYMLLEDDVDKLSDAVYKAMRCVDNLLNVSPADGACEEGPSYWKMNGGMVVNFMSALNLVTGGKVNLLHHPYVKSLAEFYLHCCVGDQWMVNFSDASARFDRASWPFVFRIGADVGSPLMMSVGAEGVQREGRVDFEPDIRPRSQSIFHELEILRRKSEMLSFSPIEPRPSFVWYPSSQLCFMENGQGLYLAAKGANNGESHNHNDVGSGILYINETPILVDAGVGGYSRKTFSDEHYTLWNNQSQYHNLPTINGVMQMNGKCYSATGTKVDSQKLLISTDIASAYPENAKVKSWVRTWQLKRDRLVVQDKFLLSEAIEYNKVHFLTWGCPQVKGDGEILICPDKEIAKLTYDARKFTPSIEEIPLMDEVLARVWEGRLYRITLTAKQKQVSGCYHFEIQAMETGAPQTPDFRCSSFDQIYSISYSGLDDGYTINTMSHFRKAAEYGFHCLKADMRLLKDGEIILCHDAGLTLDSLGRITKFDKEHYLSLDSMTLEEALSYEHCNADPESSFRPHLATLKEFLLFCKGRKLTPYITIRNERQRPTLESLRRILCETGMTDKIIINNFPANDSTMMMVREYFPDVPVSYTIRGSLKVDREVIDRIDALGNVLLCANKRRMGDIPPDVREYAAMKNIPLFGWIVQEPDEIDECLKYGAVGFHVGTMKAFDYCREIRLRKFEK